MKRLFLDVNVVLDLLLWRPPFAGAAQSLWAAAERGDIEAFVPAYGVTTIFYVAERRHDTRFANEVVANVLDVARVAAVDESVLKRGLALQWKDYEDAACAAAAEATECALLVTRDPTGFPDSPIPVVDPATALKLLKPPGGPDEVAEPAPRYSRARKRRRRQVAKGSLHTRH